MVKFGKCPRCGCEGIHACMGENIIKNGLDMSNDAIYNRMNNFIDHVRKSEKERKNDNRSC